jgi:hypothetical protein
MVIFELSAAGEPLTETHPESMITMHINEPIKDRVLFIRSSRGLQSFKENILIILWVDEASTMRNHRKNPMVVKTRNRPLRKLKSAFNELTKGFHIDVSKNNRIVVFRQSVTLTKNRG